MKNPLSTPFVDGKLKGMSGGGSASGGSGGKAPMPKSSPSGKMSGVKGNMARKSGMSGK